MVGVADPDQAALNIENQINDAILPQPDYTISVNSATKVITLEVRKGDFVPYRYHGKAYRRNGTSTIEVDAPELNRLILEGKNLEYCDLASSNQNLTFHYFKKYWEKNYSIPADTDLLISLGLYKQETGFTNTGELFSDQNHFPGISLVRYGKTLSVILERYTFRECSILEQYDKVLDTLTRMLTYEEVTEKYRKLRYLIPAEAIRESLINALAHRDWADCGQIQIEVFEDKMVILCPGGLPQTMTREEYLYSIRSIPRNTNLTIVLLRLDLIERLGTGIPKIRRLYAAAGQEPEISFFASSIQIELPVAGLQQEMTEIQKTVYTCILVSGSAKRAAVMKQTGFSQATTVRILNQLIQLNKIRRKGRGPAVIYEAI